MEQQIVIVWLEAEGCVLLPVPLPVRDTKAVSGAEILVRALVEQKVGMTLSI